MYSAFAGTSKSTVFALTTSTACPLKIPAITNSSKSGGKGADPLQIVVGSPPIATATSMRANPFSCAVLWCLVPTLWVCQCIPVVLESNTCILYMPTFLPPVSGSLVITNGSVIYLPASSGQHLRMGSLFRSTSSPV